MHPNLGRLPASLKRAERDSQHARRLFLGQALVIDQVEHLEFLRRQPLHQGMELGPFRQVTGLLGLVVQGASLVVGGKAVGVVVGADALGAEVLLGQIEEFAAHLQGGEVEEMPDRFNLHLRQGPVQPDHGVLENIVGLFPAAQGRIAPEHRPGEFQQAFAGVGEKGVLG